MKKPRLLIYIHYLEIGGAERSLLGLLDSLDPDKVDIDLLVNQHTGEFMSLVPAYVNLLPQLPEYSAIERPIKDIVREGHISVALRRLWGKYQHRRHARSAGYPNADESILQYVFASVTPALRDLSYLGEYDLAISFLCPHNIVLRKVKARKKVCWIHTDYSKVYINPANETPVWGGYDKIVSISDDVTKAFCGIFPTLRNKIIGIENILSPDFIRRQADMEKADAEMPRIPQGVNILSIGRFSVAKRFEAVPQMCRILLDKGLKFKWYIIGYGPDEEIRRNIRRYDVADTLILLGKKSNPYPYIKACDIYAQPSIFEGKSVTVREAQILGKPPVITAYPTAGSQVRDGVDGRIVPLDIEGCAQGIYDFAHDMEGRRKICLHLDNNDYGNGTEVEKVYALLT
ncbi:MAG: glycosyltransferase [Muribaculaceae bacterium]|nr:glycosyltransferase [Muribaculaceae bacterium]